MLSDSCLLAWDGDLALADRRAMVPVCTAIGVPLVFKILVSQGSFLTEIDSADGPQVVGVTGDFEAGLAKLVAFFDELVWQGLFDPEELHEQTGDFLVSLASQGPPHWVTLEVESAPGVAEAMLAEAEVINETIVETLVTLEQLKRTGDVHQMWQLIGLDSEPPVVRRPHCVTTVCVLSMLAALSAVLASFSRMLLPGSEAYVDDLTRALLLTTVISIIIIGGAVLVMSGSATARGVLAVLAVIRAAVDIIDLMTGRGTAWAFINYALLVICLGVLYSPRANSFFEDATSRRKTELP